jgi:excisionase family DNA binding protein
MTVNDDAALLPIDEAAARLGTTARFLRRLVAERRIPYFKIGRHVRFRVADLDSFIAAGRVEARR